MFEIKDRFTERVIYSSDKATTVREAVIEAVANGANLSGATLSRANLSRANLYGANLDGATLYGANLLPIKSDFFEVLLNAPHEVAGLKQALLSGEVDGSTYEGPCCCLVGTLAKVRNCKYNDLMGIKPNSDRAAERWFMGIRKGNTPETNTVAKITLEWIEEFEAKMAAANGVFAAATEGGDS